MNLYKIQKEHRQLRAKIEKLKIKGLSISNLKNLSNSLAGLGQGNLRVNATNLPSVLTWDINGEKISINNSSGFGPQSATQLHIVSNKGPYVIKYVGKTDFKLGTGKYITLTITNNLGISYTNKIFKDFDNDILAVIDTEEKLNITVSVGVSDFLQELVLVNAPYLIEIDNRTGLDVDYIFQANYRLSRGLNSEGKMEVTPYSLWDYASAYMDIDLTDIPGSFSAELWRADMATRLHSTSLTSNQNNVNRFVGSPRASSHGGNRNYKLIIKKL